MNIQIKHIQTGDDLWADAAKLFPHVISWMNDPCDHGHYHFFAASNETNTFLGGCVLDISKMGFGPLSEMMVGFLEDIEVLEAYRRNRIATPLLLTALDYAWHSGCGNVRWTVKYNNASGIGFYRSLGFAFIPDEDAETGSSTKQYLVVATNPKLSGEHMNK